jgi:hypothetical protein
MSFFSWLDRTFPLQGAVHDDPVVPTVTLHADVVSHGYVNINPMSGLPMVDGSIFDIGGNVYGTTDLNN